MKVIPWLPLLLLLAGLGRAVPTWAQDTTNAGAQIAAVQAEMDAAIAQVKKIINQPVTRLTQTTAMDVAVYSPGWFHPGAVKPDFNTVDIRSTQETPYATNHYVSSDITPGVVFLGSELEFNALTKYFYTDRSLPKKKLTQAEMLEINRLYRIIGRDERQLAQLRFPRSAAGSPSDNPDAASQPAATTRFVNPYTISGLATLGILIIFALSRRKTE